MLERARFLALVQCLQLVVATSFVLTLGACAKRCRPGLQLVDGRCLGMDPMSQSGDAADAAVDIDGSTGDKRERPDSGAAPDETNREANALTDAGASASMMQASAGGAPGSWAAKMAGGSNTSGSDCGDGVVQAPEICDPGSGSQPCPLACVDANPCTEDVLTGSAASCSSECKHNAITAAVAGDGCCPAGATPSTDSDCSPTCVSSPEVCDGKDNDCDDKADEGVRNDCGGCAALNAVPGDKCSAGEGECQVSGMYECDGKDGVRCGVSARATSAEACDGKDNDCDGRVDEGTINACGGCGRLDHERGEPCRAGIGACENTGTYACVGVDAVSCNAIERAPSREVCDGQDNDCNGVSDDGVGRTWYQDCDGDGFAAVGSGKDACSKPPNANGCGWTERAPSATETDCDDENEVRHPGAEPGLPISRTGQTLPPVGDDAYDLDCDGLAQPEGSGMSTGKVKQGRLEMIEFCADGTACVGNEPLCIQSLRVQGETTCGLGYRADSGCSGQVNVFFLCR